MLRESYYCYLQEPERRIFQAKLVNKSERYGLFPVADYVPNDFPSRTIARYYFHPVISDDLGELQADWDRDVPVHFLKEWTKLCFDWKHAHLSGKFVRVLAHPMLVKRLLSHIARKTDGSRLIRSPRKIKGGDGGVADQELRVQFRAADVVEVDISKEVRQGYEANFGSVLDPRTSITAWVPRWIVQYGAPTAYQEWEAAQARKKAPQPSKRK